MSDALRRCLLRLLEGPVEGAAFVDRLLLALIAHCAQDPDNGRAISDIESSCSCERRSSCLRAIFKSTNADSSLLTTVLTRFEFELEKGSAMACLTVRNQSLCQLATLIAANTGIMEARRSSVSDEALD